MKFLMGLGIGMGLGLLFAPAAGSETRRRLFDVAGDLSEVPRKKAIELADIGQEKAGQIGADVGRRAAEAAVGAIKEEMLGGSKRKAI